MGIRYTLELSEEQAKIIKIALEEYFRLRMNQTRDFADDICFDGFDCGNHTKEDFNERMERRDLFKLELESLMNAVHPLQFRGEFREQTIEMLRVQDIWQVIRHQLWNDRYGNKNDWCVDSRKPISMTGEALPKMERAEDEV